MPFKLLKRLQKADESKFGWPDAGEFVWVRLPCCDAIHPTHVTRSHDDRLTIKAPARPHETKVETPEEDRAFTIGWREGAASMQVQVNFLSEQGDPATWTLQALSEAPELVQRRRFVRAAWDREVVCYLGAGTLKGRVLDLSEGGLRCLLPAIEQPEDPSFQIALDIEGARVMLTAEVVWWSHISEEAVQAGVAFIGGDDKSRARLKRYTDSLLAETDES